MHLDGNKIVNVRVGFPGIVDLYLLARLQLC